MLAEPAAGPLLADVDRFGSQKPATSYAGLVPGSRESAGKRRDLGIEKSGSTLLRWALVEAAPSSREEGDWCGTAPAGSTRTNG